ncbi:DNA-directed DNA polymerase [Flavobacteriaceae bacterium UJ101]|nr:DNA-directed DNA polymerase [Flavobacteriaceae bacterium UJ101]
MEAKEKVVETTIDTTNLPKDEFKQLHVDAFWKEYLNELKKSGDFAVFNALNHVKVELKENFELLFRVTSNATQEEFNKQRNIIGRKFKEGLNNHHIQLKTEIVEIESGKILYNPKEKYEYLVKKNPNLEILRKNLDLDIYG